MASIVDYLKGQGQDSSFQARGKLYGAGYTGSAQQNTELLSRIQSQNKAPAQAPAPTAPKYVAPSISTPKAPVKQPVQTQDYGTTNILPESVTGIKPAQPAPTPAPTVPTPAPAPTIPTVTEPQQTQKPEQPLTPEQQQTYGQDFILPPDVTGIGENTQTMNALEEKRKAEALGAKTALMGILAQDPNSPELEAYSKRFPGMRNEFLALQRGALANKTNLELATSMSTKTPEQLNESIIAGSIIPGTEAWNKLVETNPTLVNQWAVFQKDKIVADLINKRYQVNPFDTTKVSGQILNQLMGMVMNSNALADYDSFINTDAVTNASNQIKDVEMELISAQETLDGIDNEVRAKLPAGVPDHIIAGEVANRQKGTYQKITALEQRRQSLGENYARMVEMATKRFDVYQADKEKKQNFMMEVYGVADEKEIRYEDLARQDEAYAREIALQEVEYQRDIVRQDFLTAQQRRQAIDDMKEERSYNEDIYLDQSLLALGENPVGLTKNQKMAKLAVAQKESLNKTYSSVSTPKYSPVTNSDGTVKMNPKSQYGAVINDDGSITVTGVTEGKVPANGRGQCGEFVNDFLGVPSLFKDYLTQKLDVANSNEPVVGGIGIEDVGTENGHVFIIENIGPDGTLYTIDSNYSNNNDEKVRRDVIRPGDPRYDQIVGFYDPSKDAGSGVEITDADRSRFNRRTFKPETLKTPEEKAKYEKFMEEGSIFDDPKADIYSLLEASIGGNPGTKDERAQIMKYSQALGGLQGLSETLSGINTGPVIGRLRKLDPYNVDTAKVIAEIQGLVPTVARGVFNEVGVLTDEDVKRYLGTLPSLNNTMDQNRAITGLLLTTLKNGMENNLSILARNGIDVSKMTGYLKKIEAQIAQINKTIGVKGGTAKKGNFVQGESIDTIKQMRDDKAYIMDYLTKANQ